MRQMPFLVAATLALPVARPVVLLAQAAHPAERGVYLTMFRSPATGLELRAGHLAAHAGHYPTVLVTTDHLVRVNPTVGFDVRLGGAR